MEATCPSCGRTLAAGAVACPTCGGRPAGAGTVCPSCGAPVGPGAPRCRHCGRPVAAGPRPMAGAPRPSLGDDPAMRLLLPVGRSGWAIAAGYLGLFSLLVLPAPVAVVVSAAAMWDLRRDPRKHGWGRAWFGLVLGALGTALLAAVIAGRVVSGG